MKQIIAMGGGGFSMEPENPFLDQYILNQSQNKSPKICFLPTASGDAEGYINRFYEAFNNQPCIPTHLSLFKPQTRELKAFLLNQDIIYVGGGNTKNMLVLWKEWGIDLALKEAYQKGIILTGLSAGAICWFEDGLTDSYGDDYETLEALGFLSGSYCPHYDGEADRKPAYHEKISSQHLKGGYAVDDGVALHFIDDKLARVVSSRPNARAYFIGNEGNSVTERVLPTSYLGR